MAASGDKLVYEELLEDIFKSIGDRHQTKELILTGPGGVGKSTAIKSIFLRAQELYVKLSVVCPTNKSIRNLEFSTTDVKRQPKSEKSFNKSLSTYCSFNRCYLDPLSYSEDELFCAIECCDDHMTDIRMNVNYTLETKFSCLKDNNMTLESGVDILVVEESSMLDHMTYDLIKMYSDIKVILFVGDANQITPINSRCMSCDSCVFNIFERADIKKYVFREQKRHESNLDLRVQLFVNNCMTYEMQKLQIKKFILNTFPRKSLADILPLDSPIITYNVLRTEMINSLLSGGRKEFQKGDFITLDRGGNKEISTGQIAKVLSVSLKSLTFTALSRAFDFYVYELESSTQKVITLKIVASPKEYITYCRSVRGRKGFEFFRINTLIREHLSSVKFAYATTAHKAQGQTFTSSNIDHANILKHPDSIFMIRLFYSSMTRARQSIVLVDIPEYMESSSLEVCREQFKS